MEIYGKKVIDAKKPLSIHVTPEDIKKATPMSERECAAAQAIVRENKDKGAISAAVHRGVTYVEYPKHYTRYLTTEKLKDELTLLDRGSKHGVKIFEPGSYLLAPPHDKSQSLEKMKDYKSSRSNLKAEAKPKKPKGTRSEVTNIRPRGANR
jgi:mannose-6-phosphate isomerase class I